MKAVTFATFLFAAATLSAQSGYPPMRAGQTADQLKRATAQLANRVLADLMRGSTNSRAAIQEAMLAQQLDASAALLVEMVRNRRPGNELREAGNELDDLLRRAPSFGSQAGLWRQVQNAARDFNDEVGPGRGGGRDEGRGRDMGPGRGERPIIGQATWRGRVDDRVHLAIRGRSIETRTISGAQNGDGAATFTSPLPGRRVEVEVTLISGRGTARVLQQPSDANDFTAVIEIYDSAPGAQEYRLDIVWR